MKRALQFILFFIQFGCYAQDTLYKREGTIISAKILEISIKEVTYKRTDLLDGPLFVVHKNDIQKIKYANGVVDSFVVTKDIVKPRQVVYVSQNYVAKNNNQIVPYIRRGTYKYQGHILSDRNVLLLALDKNEIWKNKEIELNVLESKKSKMWQYVIGYSGAVLGGIGIYSSALVGGSSSNSNDAAFGAFAGILSGGLVVSSQIISFKYKLKRVKHANKVAELYNELSKN